MCRAGTAYFIRPDQLLQSVADSFAIYFKLRQCQLAEEVDRLGRKWLAETPWALFRVEK